MLQYSARYGDGMPTDWHLVHYGAFAQGGFAMIITEPTAISPTARVTSADVGFWSKLQVAPWKRITDFVHSVRLPLDDRSAPVRIGLQLNHSGRKGAAASPLGSNPHNNIVTVPWPTVAPTALAFPGMPTPEALTPNGIARIVADFGTSARRATLAGFDCIEINAADGYLLHQFLSPLSNKRSDNYGGVYSNRVRLLLEVITAVRISWHGPLLVRIPGSDCAIGGWTPADAVSLAVLLRTTDVDLVSVTAGGNTLGGMPNTPGHILQIAAQLRQFSAVPVVAEDGITEPATAEHALQSGAVDAVLLNKQAIREPHWPLRAATVLGATRDNAPYPQQYLSSAWK
jgi:2,4-dienoyl-CoA reductase-like NADH-dependent reductase (Old Yellow Enzyme family)